MLHSSGGCALGVYHKLLHVYLLLEYDLYATDLGQKESDGLYVIALLSLPARTEDVDKQKEEVDEEIAESRQKVV